MPPAPWLLVAGLSALLLAVATGLVAAGWPRRPTVDDWLRRRAQRRRSPEPAARSGRRAGAVLGISRLVGGVDALTPASWRSELSGQLDRAGIGTSGSLLVTRTLLACVAVACAGFAAALEGLLPADLVVVGMVAVPLLVAARVLQRAGRRRRAIFDQLPILVDLMALEQGGGGVGARTAMEFVVTRLEGEAALLLRSCLAASAATGSSQLDRQLELAGDQLQIPALSALGAVVRIQREEGVSTSSPLGQLARGLRDQQRDQLLARGRRALVLMLLPVALCILLPFILIILYPALAHLSAAFS